MSNKGDEEMCMCIRNIKEPHVGDEIYVTTDSFNGKAVVTNVRNIDKEDANGNFEHTKIIDLENTEVDDEELNK